MRSNDMQRVGRLVGIGLSIAWVLPTASIYAGTRPPGAAEAGESPIKGSVAAPRGEAGGLSESARITIQDAIRIASEKTPGKVVQAALEDEDGSVVYAVDIRAGGKHHEVLVDAGNGRILRSQAHDTAEAGERDDD